MYSRTPAPPPRRPPAPMGRPSYVRQRNVRPDFRVPPNYSGNAFQPRSLDGDGEELATLPEQDRPAVPTDEPAELPSTPPLPDRETESHPPASKSSPIDLNLTHFPFGHGLGFEELLLLGLIFFLLKEGENQPDRGDLDQTIILLAILLFCG